MPVQKYRLQNGLTVLLENNPESKVVSLNVGVKIGSAWEVGDLAGVSHLLEHMVFKGTTDYGPGQVATIVEGSGGELNAYTSFDQTVYYINLPSRHIELGLHLISQMVFEALIDPVELSREKEVVIEELRRGKDNPHSVLGEMLFGLAYEHHPYGRPIIGSEETVRGVSRDRVFEYYKTWYAPNNMVLAICGNVNGDQITSIIEKEFGKYPSREIKRHALAVEPIPTQPRFKSLAKPIQGNYLTLSFPVPQFTHPDIAGLDLLSHLLGAGDTSRLEQIVKEKKGLVNAIHSYAYTPRFAGLFMIDAQVPDKTLEQVWPAIWEEINFAKTRLFSQESLDRAKHGVRSSLHYEKETCEGTARKWISYETTADDFAFEEQYLAAIEKVTPEDLRRLAQEYLKAERMSVAILHPEGKKIPASFITAPKTSSAAQPKKKRYELVAEHGHIQKYRFQNGLRLILRENHRLPLIAVRHASLGGVRFETKGNNGIYHLISNLLPKGTNTHNALQIAEISEEIAGHVDAAAGRNSWGVFGSFLSAKKDQGLKLFSDMLLHPSFDPEEVKREKRIALEAVKNQEDSLSHLAFQKFQSLLFKKHPYGMTVLGTKKSIQSITREKMVRTYREMLNPKEMVISAVGDFKAEDFAETIADTLGAIDGKAKKHPRIRPEEKPKSTRSAEIKKNKMQAHVVLGFAGISLHQEERYAFEVLNNILSGQGGRLFLELRDKHSLAYTVTSVLVEGIEPGYFATYIGTEPQKVDKAVTGILGELKHIQSDKVSAEELDRAKNYIVGNYEIDLQKNSAIASVLAFNELYDHGLEEFDRFSKRILEVTSEEVLAVAKKYLNLNAYCMAIVRP